VRRSKAHSADMCEMRLISLADGCEVIEELGKRTPHADGWVHAVGHVEDAEIRIATQGADARRSLRGRYTLVSLDGPFGGPFGAVLSRGVPGGVETVGGHLLRAVSIGVTVAIFEGSRAPVTSDEAPAEPEPPAPEPAPRAPAAEAGGSSWAAVARARADSVRDTQEDDEEPARPDRGDIVNHFAFGFCEVIRADGDRLKIRDLHGSGRIREVVIDMLDVKPDAARDGKRVFRLSRRG
jgi:hypothetical protein